MVPCICLGVGFLALFTQQSEVQVQKPTEVRIENMRPSKLLTMLEKVGTDRRVSIVANDEQGLIKLSGNPESITKTKTLISMFDVKPVKLELKIEVASSSDRSGFEATVRLSNNQMWKTTDSETDVTVALHPRIDEDGSVTVFIHLQCRGGETDSVVRLKPGKEASLIGPSEASQQIFPFPRLGYVVLQKVLAGPSVKVSLVK